MTQAVCYLYLYIPYVYVYKPSHLRIEAVGSRERLRPVQEGTDRRYLPPTLLYFPGQYLISHLPSLDHRPVHHYLHPPTSYLTTYPRTWPPNLSYLCSLHFPHSFPIGTSSVLPTIFFSSDIVLPQPRLSQTRLILCTPSDRIRLVSL